MLGDDALACLKDLKKWLKLYDEKANRLDVARCLAEANLVQGDLLEILGAWPEHATDDRVKSKIALACCTSLPTFSGICAELTQWSFWFPSHGPLRKMTPR